MPTPSAMPFVILVIVMFVAFIVTLGAVNLRLTIAERREAKAQRAVPEAEAPALKRAA